MHARFLFLMVGACGAASLIPGCSDSFESCTESRTCLADGGDAGKSSTTGTSGKSGSSASGGDSGNTTGGSSTPGGAGAAGEAGAGGSANNCDTSKSPADEGCLVSDDYAVFVSPAGNDKAVGAGSKAKPFATLTSAAAAAGDKLVLVCSGTYDEHVSVAGGVHVHGGFKCADWSADTAQPLFKPSTTGPALKLDTVTDEVLLDNVSFEVGDAALAGETALAAIVNASPKVTLRGVSLKAGKGKTGASGALTTFDFPDAASLQGNPEGPVGDGGASKKCVCQSTLSSTGGLGGSPVDGGQSGSKGQPDLGGGSAGVPASCGSGGTGQDGSDASAASAATGATTLGTASSSGWLAAAGTDGATGSPGQGGGGGASRNASGHGGGGGCGGCGGNGGTAGKGGGASIALLALGSAVTLDACTLTTADAGNGGAGAAGQAGQTAIGAGGGVTSSINSCPGGNGGNGGAGGAGGGGAGGISVGIAWKGAMAPAVSADTTITIGKAGVKGTGGAVGSNDGIAGVAQKVLPLN